MSPGRRALLGVALAGAGGRAAAQDSPFSPPAPGRPGKVTLLVGAPGGSAADRWARGFAPFLERHLRHVQVAVANRVGLSGLSALRELADAPADGSVLAHVATPSILARLVEANEVPLLSRLRFLATVAEEPVVLVAPPGTDLAALRAARDRPVGLPPPVSASAQAAVALGDALPPEQVHFPSAAAARMAALSGNVAAALLHLPDALPALRDGRLVALGIASPERSPLLPDAPTLTEAGLPLVAATQRGFMVPAGIPLARTGALVEALRNAAADPEFAAQADSLGITPRVLVAEEWGAVATRDLAALRLRWESTPWSANRG